MLGVGAVQDARTRDLLIQNLRRPPPSGLLKPPAELPAFAAGSAVSSPITAAPITTQLEVLAALLRDRDYVRTLQTSGKHSGVPLLNARAECVPLFEMVPEIDCDNALDGYAKGRRGAASIFEVQQLFGSV